MSEEFPEVGDWRTCYGSDNDGYVHCLDHLRQYLEFEDRQIYKNRVTAHGDRISWEVQVFLYARTHEEQAYTFKSKHSWSTLEAGVQDASRVAILCLMNIYKDELTGSLYSIYPYLPPRTAVSSSQEFEDDVDPSITHIVAWIHASEMFIEEVLQ